MVHTELLDPSEAQYDSVLVSQLLRTFHQFGIDSKASLLRLTTLSLSSEPLHLWAVSFENLIINTHSLEEIPFIIKINDED